MRLKHGVQPGCLRHLIYLQVLDAEWVGPSKVDSQVSIPRRWRAGFLLQASRRRVTGLWTLFWARRSRNPFWRLSQAVTSVQRGYVLWEHLSAGYGSQAFQLDDCWILPEVYMTSSSFPVPGSVRGTRWWGALLCRIGGVWGATWNKVRVSSVRYFREHKCCL